MKIYDVNGSTSEQTLIYKSDPAIAIAVVNSIEKGDGAPARTVLGEL